jgi:pantetheine-phosphate adenylyltransferase
MDGVGMREAVTAIYPGSFDPITNGHVDIIGRAASTFDRVIVAVGRNSAKSARFSVDERLSMIAEACAAWDNVSVASFDGLLVEYVRNQNADVIIRGLRAVSDFEFEFQIALANRQMAPDIKTFFLMTSVEYLYLSSSLVKEIARLGGDTSALVPESVQRRLGIETDAEGAAKPSIH